MPSVPWIRVYQNWPRHRKTMALRKSLGTAEPILCLWLWAAENAPDGDLDGMTTKDIEDASGWQGKRGKATMAMIEAGFIDIAPDTGAMRLHNWAERAGKGVASLLKGRERARNGMRNVRANVKANVVGNVNVNSSDNPTKTLSLSLDLGTSGSSSRSISADPDRSIPRAKRPIGHDLVTLFGQVRLRVFPSTFPWNTARDTKGDAGSFASLLSDDELCDIEPTMELALQKIKSGAIGWTNPELTTSPSFAFGKWKSDFTGLREELHGCSPKPPLRQGPSPATRDPRLGSARADQSNHTATGDIPV